jgi:RsiW-degrading membrane proteinase PrsW (M82 family)
MGRYIFDLFISGFYFPGISLNNLAAGIGLGLIFGAVWYAAYFTPVLGKAYSWAVMSVSAFLTWAAVCFIQVPLQSLTTNVMNIFWSQDILMNWILLAIIPQILYSGLVQEGAKLVPVIFMWRKIKPPANPKTGLILGAVAGLGFGIFEAVWIHNSLFASGWNIASSISTTGIIYGLLPFWERFFTVAFHAASSAIAGWGLFRGRGWQFYLISSVAHAVLNYSMVLYTAGYINQLYISVYVAIISIVITAMALWLRYRKDHNN